MMSSSRHTRSIPRLLLAALAWLACDSSRTSAQKVWVVGSAPVTVAALPESPNRPGTPTVAWATRSTSGALALLNSGDGTLHLFNSVGQRLDGATGVAIGTPVWLSTCGSDSLFVWDAGSNELLTLTWKGIVSNRAKPPATEGQITVRCASSSRIAFQSVPHVTPAGRASMVPGGSFYILPVTSTVLIRSAGTAKPLLLDGLASGEMVVGKSSSGRPAGGPRPLGRLLSFALSGSEVAILDLDSSRVRFFGLNGLALASVPIQGARRPATRQFFENAANDIISTLPSTSQAATLDLLLDSPMLSTLPVATGMMSDPMGIFWLVRSQSGDTETVLEGIRSDGDRVGSVRIPKNLVVFEVGRDYVLGRGTTGTDRGRVFVYSLTRPKA